MSKHAFIYPFMYMCINLKHINKDLPYILRTQRQTVSGLVSHTGHMLKSLYNDR